LLNGIVKYREDFSPGCYFHIGLIRCSDLFGKVAGLQ
jgi:hypothetical protein